MLPSSLWVVLWLPIGLSIGINQGDKPFYSRGHNKVNRSLRTPSRNDGDINNTTQRCHERTPALNRWWVELQSGQRTRKTFDDLWRAACEEASALENPELADSCHRRARAIIDGIEQYNPEELLDIVCGSSVTT